MSQYIRPYSNLINSPNARNDSLVSSEYSSNIPSYKISPLTTRIPSDNTPYSCHTAPHSVSHNSYNAPYLPERSHFDHSPVPAQVKRDRYSRSPTAPPNSQYHAYCSDSSEILIQPVPVLPTPYRTVSLSEIPESCVVTKPVELEKKQCANCEVLTEQVRILERRVNELAIQVERPVSVDGTLLWRISDVSKQQDGCMESQVFYTSMLGYKLLGCVYLKGDKEYVGKCISAYITILQGDYDSLLDWPFQCAVSISILDQSLKGRDYLKTFLPTRTSSCFKQPFDDVKRPTGFPDFMPLTELRDPFIVDDTLFIKFKVN